MKIRSVEFAGAVAAPDAAPPGPLPQVAFSGRSNVGKSSLINTLLQRTRRKIAQVSGEPGKTRTINFYRVNDRFFLVDLPGFGYARVSRSRRKEWRRLVEGYLRRRRKLAGVVHLVDARHPPTRTDLEVMEFLGSVGLPVLVVLTKIDKLPRSRREGAVERAARILQVEPDQVLPFSARTGEGREELLEALEALLESTPEAAVEGEAAPEGRKEASP